MAARSKPTEKPRRRSPVQAQNRARRGRPPQPENTARRRDEILCAATRRFAREGYHETDLQKLADELEVGKGTIYRYFPNKEALFLAAVDRVMQSLFAEIEQTRKAGGDPLDVISRAVIAYLALFDAHPEFVELLILERAVFRDRKRPTYFEHRERNVGRWRAIYADLMSAGRVRRMPVAAITDVMSSALYGTMFTNFFAGRQKTLQAQAAQIIDVLFQGILTTPERQARVARISKGE